MRSLLPIALVPLSALLLAGGFAAASGQETGVQDSARLADLRTRAVPVRSSDVRDDFSDLAPLAAALGDARIVQLGESSHGAGATFAAKVRLVEFLHRELDFDVLLWESGMYDVRTVDDSLRAGADPVGAGALGIFSVWSATAEVAPLLEYAGASHRTDRPLELAGLDMQLSGAGAAERLEADLTRFAGAVADPGLRDSTVILSRRLMEGYGRLVAPQAARNDFTRRLYRAGVRDRRAVEDSLRVWEAGRGAELAPGPPDLERFLEVADALLALLRARRADLAIPHGGREVDFIGRVVGNLREYGISQFERHAADPTRDPVQARVIQNRGWNRRDARMADNLLWLARERYPDRKLIVWGHNGHLMNAHYRADWASLSHAPMEGGMTPMGVLVAEALGDEVYTLAFTAYSGRHGMATTAVDQPIPEAPGGSLEALLHALGHDRLLLDFRRLPPDHWLRRPATMAIRGYMPETLDDWTRVVDGVFFIDRMTPATAIRRD